MKEIFYESQKSTSSEDFIEMEEILKHISEDQNKDDIVSFDVRGTIISTLKSTITRLIKKEGTEEYYEPHLLHILYNQSLKYKTKLSFLDYSADHFSFFLDYIRNPDDELIFPDHFYMKLLREAKYFNLPGLVHKLAQITEFNIPMSSILTTNQFKNLLELLGFDYKLKWRKVYDAGYYKFSPNWFHRCCDNRSNTLTIIKALGSGYVFGGFTTKPWSQKSGFVCDSEAFIFSFINKLNEPIKFKCVEPKYAIYCAKNYGPTFGQGFDLCISHSNDTASNSSNLMCSYKSDQIGLTYGTREARSFLVESF